MTNFQIYRKTLPFAWLRMLVSLLGLLVMLALPVIAFLITQNMSENTMMISVMVALCVGIFAFIMIARYAGYLLKAGQIAMISKGVTDGQLPEKVVSAGKEAVSQRFVTASAYFGLQSAISAITRQITRGINGVASALGSLGGENGRNVAGGIGSLVSAFISIMLEYVNYCCLAWVFFKKDESSFKSTCDGAVIYFQNWKTLLKNTGKVFGFTLLSLLVVGTPLALLCHLLMGNGAGISGLTSAVAEALEIDAATSLWVIAAAVALVVWAILDTAFVKPYILISVLRRYMESAMQNPPQVDLYAKLCGISKKFSDFFDKSREAQPTADM